MLIVLHVVIALVSCGYTSYVYLSPSKKKLNGVYGLVVATLITGSYLVLAKPSHMVQSCMMGLIYIGFVTAVIFSTRHKLAQSKID